MFDTHKPTAPNGLSAYHVYTTSTVAHGIFAVHLYTYPGNNRIAVYVGRIIAVMALPARLLTVSNIIGADKLIGCCAIFVSINNCGKRRTDTTFDIPAADIFTGEIDVLFSVIIGTSSTILGKTTGGRCCLNPSKYAGDVYMVSIWAGDSNDSPLWRLQHIIISIAARHIASI